MANMIYLIYLKNQGHKMISLIKTAKILQKSKLITQLKMTNKETSLVDDKNIVKEIWADFLTLYKNFSSYNGSETEKKTIFF